MLFSIDDKKSLDILKALVAAFAVALPTVLGILPIESGIYLLFAVFVSLMAIRIKKSGKYCVCAIQLLMAFLFCYSLISSFWAGDREGHLIYIAEIGCLTAVFTVMCDYFSESDGENAQRRFLYLMVFGGVICSAANMINWLIYIVPFAKNKSWTYGFGNNNFLAIFILLCMTAALFLFKGNSKGRKRFLLFFLIAMLFTFIMAKSIVAWILAFFLIAVFLLGKKYNKASFIPAACAVAVFTVIIVFISFSGKSGIAFREVFSHGISNLMGNGGGFWSGNATFLSQRVNSVGIMAAVTAQSGIIGLLFLVSMTALNVMNFFKLKNFSGFICLIISIPILLLPFDNSFCTLVLYVGLMAYNWQRSGSVLRRTVSKKQEESLKKSFYTFMAVTALASFLLLHSFIRLAAETNFKNGEYDDAYKLYSAAAAINLADSESNKMAAESLRKGNNLPDNSSEALKYVDTAIEMDPDNIGTLEEKALIYIECGEYNAAARVYRIAADKAVDSDKYNLCLAQVLYSIIEESPRGSSETKRAYEEIVSVAQKTDDLDYKKEINDLADRALSFTKGELNGES